jgi:hypothetical protein
MHAIPSWYLQGAAAKLYKALGGLKQQLHFELEDVRSSITLQPMSLRLLDGVATAAISCSLRHAVSNPNSDGGRTSTNSSRARLQLYPSRTWHMLRPDCYISTDIAAAQPGALCHALYVELEVAAQQPDKMLINFLRAGEHAGLAPAAAMPATALSKQTDVLQGSALTSKQTQVSVVVSLKLPMTLCASCMRLARTLSADGGTCVCPAHSSVHTAAGSHKATPPLPLCLQAL